MQHNILTDMDIMMGYSSLYTNTDNRDVSESTFWDLFTNIDKSKHIKFLK